MSTRTSPPPSSHEAGEHGLTRLLDGLRMWFPVVAGVGAWTVHILALSSLARLACLHPGVVWVMHGITIACIAVTVAAIAMAAGMARAGGGGTSDEDATPVSRTVFLGQLGVIVGVFNLVLIALEGLYVGVVPRCG